MASSMAQSVVLSPLDQYMPRIYTNIFLVFETDEPGSAVDSLKAGLERLNQRLPYLKGRVFATDGGRVGLRWSLAAKNVELQEMPTQGLSISDMSFAKLKDEGAPLGYFPPSLSPLPALANLDSGSGAPVFAANYTLLDGGVVVGLSAQHNVMDGTGVVELIRLWAACTRSDPIDVATPLPDPDEPLHRSLSLRLATGQATPNTQDQAQAQPSRPPFSDLLARHPEFTIRPTPAAAGGAAAAAPPTIPSPAGTSRLFTFATAKLETVKTALLQAQKATSGDGSASQPPITTNSVLCALVWSCVTRVRAARRRRDGGGFGAARSRLGFAVNGRARLGPPLGGGSARPFLGNVNLYGLAGASVSELVSATATATATAGDGGGGDWSGLGGLVEAVARAIGRVTPGYVAEVMDAVEQVPDAGAVLPGWSGFHGPDLTVTSWANMGVYEADFGEAVGRAAFMRVPRVERDGFLIVLPRKRGGPAEGGMEAAAEGIEVFVAMHTEDMTALEGDAVWTSYLA